MKKLSFILVGAFLLLGLGACNYAKFDCLPGEKLENIPVEIQGLYDFQLSWFKSSHSDSFFVNIESNRFVVKNKSEDKESIINSNFYLYRIKNYFVMGLPDQNFKSLWNVMVIEPLDNGLKIYVIDENKKNVHVPSKLLNYLQERESPLSHEPIVSAPDANGGVTTPPMTEGSGPNLLKYYLMNDEQFIVYFEKEIKGKDFILLKRHSPKAANKGNKK